ncbi:UNVERIFIED_CONTAM: hypothetical protein GTU68_050050 [Idotea baltica]|nr:hypothetical protein [Idotea baltica]
MVLGGGSNVLFNTDKTSLDILLIETKGIEILVQNENSDLIEIAAGENWHEFVLWSIEKGYGGIENLSLIPGTIGAAPIQNIGAYGVELKDVLHSVNVYDIEKKHSFTLHKSECKFGYRDSIFKTTHKGKFIITSICLELTKSKHKITVNYGAITKELEANSIIDPTPKQISDTVIKIRSSKLPDPKVLGNGGSFFKNPIVPKAKLDELLSEYENVPNYPAADDLVKLPAGWLIEKAGWKGQRIGDVGCHKDQALVIVNYGNATGAEIWNHAMKVQNSVQEKYGIKLTPEVNLISE